MVQAQACKRCSQAHDCKKIYQQLGQAEGPSIALEVLVAFALPIVAFLAGLAGFGHLLGERLGEPFLTPAVFVLALLATTGCVPAASLLVKRLG